jgi:hypothetical protein|tara:strand:+ start:1286 stop:1534 length:249 start_codon:yes stop_codon:yes gene_type:complete
VIIYDGFDEAVIGIVYRCGMEPVTLYDQDKCLEILMEQGLSPTDAMEHFNFNVAGGYIGPDTPCFAVLDPDEVLEMLPERAN